MTGAVVPVTGVDVRLHLVPLLASPEVVATAETVLSVAERERAARFHFTRHRRRFVVGRATMRRVLGSILDLSPAAVPLTATPQGKPVLSSPEPLYFNLSNSGDHALLAVTDRVPVGVDLEVAQPLPDLTTVARAFFAHQEAERVLAVEPEERVEAFYRVWTRKEALLKGVGGGLLLPLSDFEVSHEGGGRADILRHSPALARGSWRLLDVSAACPRGTVAALAVDSELPVRLAPTHHSEGETS